MSRMTYNMVFDGILQATIPRLGNKYFSKTLEAHIQSEKVFLSHFSPNIFKISFHF